MSQDRIGFLKGRVSALLTKHNKEKVIKPVFESETGCKVQVVNTYNTDLFGTFTGDVERPGTQLETAMLKARCGMQIAGCDIGLSSEGSFGPHPSIPFVPYNIEVVMLVDDTEKIEIYGEWATCETNFSHEIIDSLHKAETYAASIGFPEHQIVIKPYKANSHEIIKGINNLDDLRKAVDWAISTSSEHKAVLETDMRAHANPTRMMNILKATENLIEKLNSLCPECSAPGFWLYEKKTGLPCEWCNSPTNEVLADIFLCGKCGYRKEIMKASEEKASAGKCNFCNP